MDDVFLQRRRCFVIVAKQPSYRCNCLGLLTTMPHSHFGHGASHWNSKDVVESVRVSLNGTHLTRHNLRVSTKLPALSRYRYTPLARLVALNVAWYRPGCLSSLTSVWTSRPRMS